MKVTKLTLIIVVILLLVGLTAFLIIYHQPGFTGERTKNLDSYILDIKKMNGADSHTLNLTAGDVLQVKFETERGSLRMEITAPDGTILYAGNGEETTEFEISISETGAYIVTVEARHAEGKINIQPKEISK